MAIKNPLLAAKRPGMTPVKGTKMKKPAAPFGAAPKPPGMKKGGMAKCYSKGGKS